MFVQIRRNDRTEIIHARLAYPLSQTSPNGGSEVYLDDAHIYAIGHDDDQVDRILSAKGIVVNPNSPDGTPPEYSSVAASTPQLAVSNEARDVAELQWRLSTPVSTLLLGLMGVPLSRGKPRQNRYEKFGAAILIYSAYYLLCTSARTWVQHGVVGGFPGIWWAPATLGLVLLAFLYGPELRARFRRRRA